MIIAIRISGLVEIPNTTKETLYRIRLRRKYTASLFEDNPQNRKLLQGVRNFIAYGIIDDATLRMLIEKRGEMQDKKKKMDVDKIASELQKKSLEEVGLKPFFRLHPPRGGINTKLHFPMGKGVLGDHKEKINDLIRRML